MIFVHDTQLETSVKDFGNEVDEEEKIEG